MCLCELVRKVEGGECSEELGVRGWEMDGWVGCYGNGYGSVLINEGVNVNRV